MDLVLFRESNFSFLKTNEEGILQLSNDVLLVNDGRKLFVKGMGKKTVIITCRLKTRWQWFIQT